MRRLLALWGLRGLLGVCRMCSRLVGRPAAANVFPPAATAADVFPSAGAEPAAPNSPAAAPQGRRKACGNAAHQFGAPAECDIRHAGPTTHCTGDAGADDGTREVASASPRRAGIDPGLIDTEPAFSQDQPDHDAIKLHRIVVWTLRWSGTWR